MEGCNLARYSYSTVQFDLPDDVAQRVVAFAGRLLDKADIVKTETKPHVTIQYGLVDNDPDQLKAALQTQKSCKCVFGQTDYFPDRGDGDVVVLKVSRDGLERLRSVVRDNASFVERFPDYRPHVTLGYVKPGQGAKYKGRTDMEGEEVSIQSVVFSSPDGQKTDVNLDKQAQFPPGLLEYPASQMALGGLLGGAGGRWIAAPIMARLLGFDPDRLRTTMTMAGLLAGAAPGALVGMRNSKMLGDFWAPGSRPRNARQNRHYLSYLLPRPAYKPPPDRGPVPFSAIIKSSDAATYSEDLWRPNFPVARALDDIERNPYPNIAERVKMKQLIAGAGIQQGVGLTGMASPGALASALPDIAGNAIPTMLGAYVVSNLLGAPSWLKNTAVGAAATYSALKGFMSKNSNEEASVMDKKMAFKVAFLTKMAEAGITPRDVEEYLDKQAANPLESTALAATKGGLGLGALARNISPAVLLTALSIPFVSGAALGHVAHKVTASDDPTVKDLRNHEVTDRYWQLAASLNRRLGRRLPEDTGELDEDD